MSNPRKTIWFGWLFAFISYASFLATAATADPLPGRDLLKFSQQPMISTGVPDPNGTVPTYYGHDELSTAYGFSNAANPPQDYSGRFMADDFADNLTSPILHVKWWGSYLNAAGPQDPNMPVNKFLISFESDVPQSGTNPFSHPGTPLLNQVVNRGVLAPGSGTFTEKLIRPATTAAPEALYEYNAELHLGLDFPEAKDTVYWLKIAAMVDVTNGTTFPTSQPPVGVTQWGWHNRDYTTQNTLASPNVVGPPFPPGEAVVGSVGINTPVWHFQDDAVTGDVRILPIAPSGFLTPVVIQPPLNMSPTHYQDFLDGPGPGLIPGTTSIGQFSKDLAFELYVKNVPEPATCMMLLIGCLGLAGLRHRRS